MPIQKDNLTNFNERDDKTNIKRVKRVVYHTFDLFSQCFFISSKMSSMSNIHHHVSRYTRNRDG